MSYLNNDDKEYFIKKFKKIQYENKLLQKKNKKELKNLLNIKNRQREALDQIFDYLNNITISNKLSTSQLDEIHSDELEILKELDNLKNFINNVK